MSLASMILEELEQRDAELKQLQEQLKCTQAMLKFCDGMVGEQKAIIKQLAEGPGEVEYIHPYDLAELLNSFDKEGIVDIWKYTDSDNSLFEMASTGKKYKQSLLIPAKTKNII